MRLITLSIVAVILWSGAAFAQRHGGGRGRSVIRDHRVDRGPVRGDRQPIYSGRQQYGGTVRGGMIRTDRRVVHRRPVYSTGGGFTFYNGRTVPYRRTNHQRYYDSSIRPQVIVESYPSQSGYIWVAGSWSWTGYEWAWTAGYYAPDPQYQNYYDDGSYDPYQQQQQGYPPGYQ